MLKGWRRQAINATAIAAVLQIQQGLEIVRHRPRMLNRLSVHIQHEQCSIGRVQEVDRAKPIVR